ncbi:LuxR C-terminal-related transcriptional regulator [Dactylosporangium sp. NBC_01737]|uniref:LuxR C-terminal-related transcriptional regulator n=1 Tax=Dactylosporangium sp. NBC_01737 TaxID=2975959 RepID=UPI002E0EDF9E|nr:LuxR C-terminal-related transcriptional regulator [Dactylosporangium sp. NBC_01737]
MLAELALGLSEEGLVRQDNGTVRLVGRRIPRRVLESVRLQLSELSKSCQQFLKVAAALGRSFMLEDVSRMLDRSSATLLAPLDEAIASGFVVVAGHELAFASEFLLRGIIESIPAPARDAVRREATKLSRRRIQGHDHGVWESGRPRAPHGAGTEVADGSCSTAHSLIMNGDAAAGVRVAEHVLNTPGTSRAARLDAEASLILGYFLLGRQEGEQVSDRVLRERGTEPGDIAALMALTARSTTLWRAGDLTESLDLGRVAVHYGEDCDPAWRLHFQLALAGKLANLREFDKAESLIIEAESGLRRLPTPIWAAAPAVARSRLYLQSGRILDARREAAMASAAAGRDGVPMLRPLAHCVLSMTSLYMGDLPAAVEYLRQAHSEAASHTVFDSVQYAWTELLVTAKKDGPHAAARLLTDKHQRLPTRRSLYIEDPSAAAFLVRLARDTGDTDLEVAVLDTVDGLSRDNPGVPVVGLTALHANALAKSAPAALALIIVQSPDPISVALATEELAKIYAPGTPVRSLPLPSDESAGGGARGAACWSALSDKEQRIAYLVSTGLTNRQIAKQVYLSEHTVNYHLRKVYKKLGFNTRVELAHAAAIYSRGAAIYSMGDEGWSADVDGEAV